MCEGVEAELERTCGVRGPEVLRFGLDRGVEVREGETAAPELVDGLHEDGALDEGYGGGG